MQAVIEINFIARSHHVNHVMIHIDTDIHCDIMDRAICTPYKIKK